MRLGRRPAQPKPAKAPENVARGQQSYATRVRAMQAPAPTDAAVLEWSGLVWAVVHRTWPRIPEHCRRPLSKDELYDAGMLGLLKALRGYDPDRGVPFAGYAASRIRWHVLIAAGLTRQGWPPAARALDWREGEASA